MVRTQLISSVNINVNMHQKMHVLYLDGGGSYLAVCVSQISSKYTLNWDAFHFM